MALLKQADKSAGNDLGRLLRMKTKAGYSARSVSNAEYKQAERASSRLVEKARRA